MDADSSLSWQPIDTAPLGVRVLLWWVGDNAPLSAHGAIIAVVTYYEIGDPITAQPVEPLRAASYWDGTTYRDLAWVTHWMPLPQAPEDEDAGETQATVLS